MVIAETLVLRGDAELLEEHLAFQRAAGVDVVYVTGRGVREREGVRVVEDADRTRLARLAAEEGADWVLHAEANEFWWPRGESLEDVLAPIPPRYTLVQGLRRELVREGDERVGSRRRPVREGAGAAVLRPVHRAGSDVRVGEDGVVTLPHRVPLRAWYPVEVLTVLPATTGEGELLVDTRLRDALGAETIAFRTPDVVDDAAYAVECAAVGEVDLPRLEAYIEELEQRVAWLEQRLWPRVQRRLGRLVGR
jgi:hypothetical protein